MLRMSINFLLINSGVINNIMISHTYRQVIEKELDTNVV